MIETLQEKYCRLIDKIMDMQFENLNEEQKKAVLAINDQVLILAGAGSGKTTVIVNRIHNMITFGDVYGKNEIYPNIEECHIENMERYIENQEELSHETLDILSSKRISPWSILAITFTNKAAKEMKERIAKKVGPIGEKIWISTFHSTCVRILRKDIDKLGYSSDFTIYDSYDQKSLIRQCMKELDIDEKSIDEKEIARQIGTSKDELISADTYKANFQGDFRKNKIAEAYLLYQKKLKQNNALDFDDLIFKTVELFTKSVETLEFYQNKFKYIMVDEYQDTNKAQYMLVKLLADKYKNICVVGDEDQCIYEWRGADINNILNFEKDYKEAKIIKLEKNYRSKGNILEAANSIIVNNTKRKDKTLVSTKEIGEKITIYRADNENYEVEYICNKVGNIISKDNMTYKDFAILYRTNSQSRGFEEFLVRRGIPYRVIGGLKFYDRKEIKDILAYLKVINNPSDSVSLSRIINVPKRNIGDTTVDKLTKAAIDFEMSLYDVIANIETIGGLSARTANNIRKFSELMEDMGKSKDTRTISQIIYEIFEKTDYLKMYQKSKDPEDESRVENLKELYNSAIAFEKTSEDKSLAAYLEQVTLVSDVDNYDDNADSIVLMTVHSSKGLEFPVVFLSGMENGVFPSNNSFNMNSEMEESRRLCYVGITRAKEKLFLTSSCSRRIFGKTTFNAESLFLDEIEPINIYREGESSVSVARRNNARNKEQSEFERGLDRLSKMFEDKSRTTESIDNIKLGSKVSHEKFGEGTIVSINKANDMTKATIAFDNMGVKMLILEKSPIKLLTV